MAKLDKISGNEYDEFSTNELYLRQEAILNGGDQEIILNNDEGGNRQTLLEDTELVEKLNEEKISLYKQNDKDQYYITLDDLLALNELVEEQNFGGGNVYMDDNQVQIVMDLVDTALDGKETEKNTVYGTDKLTEEQRERASEYMGDGADNVKNMYLQAAQVLYEEGYWGEGESGQNLINQRMKDIMSGKRLIGESFGVMMDELKERNLIENDKETGFNFTDKASEKYGLSANSSLNAYSQDEILEYISEENQSWSDALETSSQQGLRNELLKSITKLLYGDDKDSDEDDRIFKDQSQITITDKDGNEIQDLLSNILDSETLQKLDTETLQSQITITDKDGNEIQDLLSNILDSETLQKLDTETLQSLEESLENSIITLTTGKEMIDIDNVNLKEIVSEIYNKSVVNPDVEEDSETLLEFLELQQTNLSKDNDAYDEAYKLYNDYIDSIKENPDINPQDVIDELDKILKNWQDFEDYSITDEWDSYIKSLQVVEDSIQVVEDTANVLEDIEFA